MMTEDRGVHVHPHCRNALNPFHQCSDYCFRIISEIAMEALSISKTTGIRITKAKDDGFGLSPTTPLSEGDQSGNLIVDDLSALLVTNDDDEAEIITKLTKKQKKMLRNYWTYKEAIKAHQAAMVHEKKVMEPPEEMAQEKQLAPVVHDDDVSGEKFVNDFITAFPPLTYHGDKGGEEIYAPPIPVKADNSKDMSMSNKVGAYPDHVVLSIANERDKLKAQLEQVMKETTNQKMMYQDERRQAELWRAKYYAIANAPPPAHGLDSGHTGARRKLDE